MDDADDRGFIMNYLFAEEHEWELIQRFQSPTCE